MEDVFNTIATALKDILADITDPPVIPTPTPEPDPDPPEIRDAEPSIPVLSTVEVGMPAKIPLYKGPAGIIDLTNILSLKFSLRKATCDLKLLGVITLVSPGIDSTSTTNNYKISWLIFKTLANNSTLDLDTDDGQVRLSIPQNNPGAWGVLPQNRLASRKGDKSRLYYSCQILTEINYYGGF
jgi:hypothetical protein